jgi:hypothetical protein
MFEFRFTVYKERELNFGTISPRHLEKTQYTIME